MQSSAQGVHIAATENCISITVTDDYRLSFPSASIFGVPESIEQCRIWTFQFPKTSTETSTAQEKHEENNGSCIECN